MSPAAEVGRGYRSGTGARRQARPLDGFQGRVALASLVLREPEVFGSVILAASEAAT